LPVEVNMKNVVIATANIGKFEEIKAILLGEFSNFYSLTDFEDQVEVTEDSLLYLENVLKKARKIGDRFNMDTIADDSGIEVAALRGRPGVFSSRYGKDDEDRINKMLVELKGIPWEKRGAVFKAYITLYMPEKERSYVFYGSLKGYIGLERQGQGGFGYDPIFYVPEMDKYAAELTMEEKNRLSHRGRALHALKKFLNTDFFRNSKTSQ
jgi:XTP/dITP diphosphohydrolase